MLAWCGGVGLDDWSVLVRWWVSLRHIFSSAWISSRIPKCVEGEPYVAPRSACELTEISHPMYMHATVTFCLRFCLDLSIRTPRVRVGVRKLSNDHHGQSLFAPYQRGIVSTAIAGVWTIIAMRGSRPQSPCFRVCGCSLMYSIYYKHGCLALGGKADVETSSPIVPHHPGTLSRFCLYDGIIYAVSTYIVLRLEQLVRGE